MGSLRCHWWLSCPPEKADVHPDRQQVWGQSLREDRDSQGVWSGAAGKPSLFSEPTGTASFSVLVSVSPTGSPHVELEAAGTSCCVVR